MGPDFIESQAQSIPDRLAVWFDDKWFTYTDLNRRAKQLAVRLRALGVRPGDRVAILALNHIAHLDLTLAATKLGHVHVPLNYRLGPVETSLLVERVTPTLLFVDPPREDVAATLGLPWLRLSDYEAWLASTSDEIAATPPALAPTADDLHMILFTGGSTGLPKGACLPYRQTLGNAMDTVAAWGLQADDRVIQCTPCFHAAINVLCLPLLMAGGSIVLTPRFEPAEYLRLAVQHTVTRLFMVPTMYRALIDDDAFASIALPAVRSAITGGAPCPPDVRSALAARGIDLRLGYGMTEAGVNCFSSTAEEAARAPGSVGRPMPNVNLVLREQDGTPITESGRIGEITMSGPHICAGYFCGADADAEAQGFRDGWLWSGDLASFDDDGLYTIRGRRKDIYISGGENIHPVEIENALGRCTSVVECTVFGWPHPHWGECGIALVVSRSGMTIDESTLRADLRTQLAGYKMPAEIRIVAELPRTASGKIDKPRARALYATMTLPEPVVDVCLSVAA